MFDDTRCVGGPQQQVIPRTDAELGSDRGRQHGTVVQLDPQQISQTFSCDDQWD